MRGRLLAVVSCVACGLLSPPTEAAGLSAYASLTTDYRELGLSQSHGAPALQLGVDYQHSSGFFTGLTALAAKYSESGKEQAARLEPNRRSRLEAYAGYSWRSEVWSATTAFSRYIYPQSDLDYDYNEVAAGFGYRGRVFVTLTHAASLLAYGPSLFAADLSFNVPAGHGFTLGGSLGRVASDAFAGGRYTHWNLGASKTLGPITADLRFYDNDARSYRGVYGAPSANFYGAPLPDQWVFSLSYGLNAR